MEATVLQTTPAAASNDATAPAFTFRDMRLRVGDRAQLEPPAQTGFGRLAVAVVGWIEGSCLIVTQPRTERGRLDLEAGEIVLLRAFTGRRAFAFRCSVLKRSAPPFEFLNLSFPDRVDGLEVRNAPRHRVDLRGTAMCAGAEARVELLVENVSATGALLVASEPLGVVGEGLKLDFAFVLHEVPVALSLDCTLRSTSSGESAGEPCYRHGVSFEALEPNARLALSALVWFGMYENPRLAA